MLIIGGVFSSQSHGATNFVCGNLDISMGFHTSNSWWIGIHEYHLKDTSKDLSVKLEFNSKAIADHFEELGMNRRVCLLAPFVDKYDIQNSQSPSLYILGVIDCEQEGAPEFCRSPNLSLSGL